MNKQEFLTELKTHLGGLPQKDVDEHMDFYSEMIDDRIEDGLSEEKAIADIGAPCDIATQIIKQTPITKIAKEKINAGRKLKAWEIVLLAVGSPIWFSLLVAAFAVFLALYVSIWSVAIALWAVFASFVACAPVGLTLGILAICFGEVFSGIATIGVGLVFAGLSIFIFVACTKTTKGIVLLTKGIALWFKKRLVRRENT